MTLVDQNGQGSLWQLPPPHRPLPQPSFCVRVAPSLALPGLHSEAKMKVIVSEGSGPAQLLQAREASAPGGLGWVEGGGDGRVWGGS